MSIVRNLSVFCLVATILFLAGCEKKFTPIEDNPCLIKAIYGDKSISIVVDTNAGRRLSVGLNYTTGLYPVIGETWEVLTDGDTKFPAYKFSKRIK